MTAGETGAGTRTLGSAVIALTGARLLAAGAQFIAGILAARLLDPAAVGVAGVGLTVGWIVAICANGGLNIAAIYFLGRRPEERDVLIPRFVGLGLGAVAVAVLATAIAAPIVGVAVLDQQAPALFAAAAGLGAGTLAYELTGALLLGIGNRRAYVGADIIRSVASLGATIVVLAVVSRTAEGYVAATAIGTVVPAVFALVVVRRRVPSIRPRANKAFGKDALRLGLAGQVGNILSFLNLRLDLLLVPALVRLEAAGIYFIATRVAEVVGQASNAAAAMLFPHVAAQEDRDDTTTTERTSRWTLLASLAAAAVLAAIASPLLGWFFGDAYRAGSLALLWLLGSMLPLALARVLGADLKGRGRPGLVSISTGVGAVVTVVANLALIPPFGIEGAAVASVLAYLTSAITMAVFYRRVTGGALLRLLPRPADLVELVRLVRSKTT